MTIGELQMSFYKKEDLIGVTDGLFAYADLLDENNFPDEAYAMRLCYFHNIDWEEVYSREWVTEWIGSSDKNVFTYELNEKFLKFKNLKVILKVYNNKRYDEIIEKFNPSEKESEILLTLIEISDYRFQDGYINIKEQFLTEKST